MDNNPESSGICQRLFRLILGALMRRPSPALPPPPPRLINGDNPSSSEIAVELRHHSAKDALILSGGQTKLPQNGVDERGREKEYHQGKKRVSIEGSERNIKGRERKEVTIHSATMANDETKSRRHWPLLSVASNINEKSEAFIERKKRAMGINYSHDQDQTKK